MKLMREKKFFSEMQWKNLRFLRILSLGVESFRNHVFVFYV